MTAASRTVVLILLSFPAFAHCTVSGQTAADGDGENGIEPDGRQPGAAVGEGPADGHGANATAAAVGRTGRQYYGYRPSAAAGFAYLLQPLPQRRAYKGPPHPKKRPPPRNKPSGRRPRPRRRPAGRPPPTGRFRRPAAWRPPLQQQHTNYVDSPPSDYVDVDGFESSAPYDYVELDAREPYDGPGGASPTAVVRPRKRPAGAADEPQATAIVHVPVRVHARPAAATPAPPTVDPMEKLRQMVQEAMEEHFASRHQELYADGFGKERVHGQRQQYSAKYKRQQQQTAADKDKQAAAVLQRSAAAEDDENAATTAAAKKGAGGDATSYPAAADADADGSDSRPLTLAEISAYMGAKPAETVLSAGGHRYVLSDALQHTSYRQQQQQRAQHEQYDVEDHHSLHRGQQYLRYVSPFEALYEVPAARWTYEQGR